MATLPDWETINASPSHASNASYGWNGEEEAFLIISDVSAWEKWEERFLLVFLKPPTMNREEFDASVAKFLSHQLPYEVDTIEGGSFGLICKKK